jgi:hypothetical protein
MAGSDGMPDPGRRKERSDDVRAYRRQRALNPPRREVSCKRTVVSRRHSPREGPYRTTTAIRPCNLWPPRASMVRGICMCTVLYWAQGWWSVTDLAIEIAGFSAFSLDVAREYAVTLGSLFSYRCPDGRLDPSPAELRAALTCPREPGVDALPNYAALKFRKHAEHLKHRLAGGRRRRIEPLLVKEPALSPLLRLQRSVARVVCPRRNNFFVPLLEQRF